MRKTHRGLALITRTLSAALLACLFCGIPSVGQKSTEGSARSGSGCACASARKDLLRDSRGLFFFHAYGPGQRHFCQDLQLIEETETKMEALRIYDEETTTAIADGDVVIMTITSQDAKAAGKSRQVLAQEYTAKIREAAESLRQRHSLRVMTISVLWGVRDSCLPFDS